MNSETLEELLQRNNELLETLVKLQLKYKLEEELSDSMSRDLYALTGKFPVSEISERLKVSVGKISGIWQRWEQQGLITKDGRSYRRII